jgi:hypothetical protein
LVQRRGVCAGGAVDAWQCRRRHHARPESAAPGLLAEQIVAPDWNEDVTNTPNFLPPDGNFGSTTILGQAEPASAPPQEGDLLVKLDDPASKPIGAADVGVNAPPLIAWPMDPVSRTVRKANRLNEILLVRLNRPDRLFRALDASTGQLLWQMPTNSGVMGQPSTFMVNGKQYVAVMSGWGGDAAGSRPS